MTDSRHQTDDALRAESRRTAVAHGGVDAVHPQSFPALPCNDLVPLAAVLCTEELNRRPTRSPDHETENRALVALAQALADSPRTILQTLAEKILEVLKADSAGVSLLTDDAQRFFWPAIAGAWRAHLGGGTPRDFGPCGDVLDANGPLLFRRLERRYTYFMPVTPLCEECLLVPFYIEGNAVGTIWAIAHDDRRTFDAEDLRQLESLGGFASAAYQSQIKSALEQRRAALRLEEVVQSGQATETLNAELRASEDALRRSEGDLRDFVENAAVGLHWVGPDGIILWANQTELDLLGYTREEYVGHHIADFHADPPVIADILARLTGGETLRECEARVRCHDGSIRHVSISSNALIKNETLVHTRCFTRDITERKQAEEALRESEAFNRSIVESSPDCIKVLDLDGHLLSMLNGQALLGIEDIRPFLNTSWIEFWEGEDRLGARAAVTAAAAGGEGRFVGFFRTLRGESKWWDVTISPILDADGKPARLLAISRDVTLRRRADMNLAFLASVSQDLARVTGVDDMIRTVGAKIGAYLTLSLCAFVEINEPADEVVIFHDWHRDDVPGLVGVYRLADFVEEEFIRTARTGEIIVVRDIATDPRTALEKFAPLNIASFICVPLIRDGQWRFALCLYHSAAYDWREDEIELTRELTARIWTRLERLRSEDALRTSEARYRNLFNSIDEGFCIFDMLFDEHGQPVDYRFTEVNPSFERQSGLHDVTGKRIRELAPDHEAYWFEHFGKVALTGEPVRLVNEAFDRWFDIYAFRIGGPESRKVAALFTNISERKKAEMLVDCQKQALQRLAEGAALEDVLEFLTGVVERHSPKGMLASIVPLNDAGTHFKRGIGASLPEGFNAAVEGVVVSSLGGLCCHAVSRGEPVAVRDFHEGTEWQAFAQLVAPFGLRSGWSTPIVSSSGHILGTFANYYRHAGDPTPQNRALVDIVLRTAAVAIERTRAEEALRQSEERFRALFDQGAIAMYSCDASGTIQDFNRGAVDLWGRAPTQGDTDERFGGSLKLYLPDGTVVPPAHTLMADVLEGKIPAAHDMEIVIERPDGSRIITIANIVPLKNGQGEITGAINCFYDISERSRLERKTQEQAEALVDLHRRKDEFLAMLSHELRSPLAPISNAVQLLRLQKNEGPLQQQARTIIERQVGQLNHLVDDLLEVSRITTGRVQLRQDRIVVSGIVERAVETARPLIEQRRHELTVTLPPHPIWLHADAARLEQVVVNLLTNAAKYTDEGGHIWLTVEQEGEAAVLRVRDTGTGIAPELLPRIFDLFTQAERSLDRSQGGLGIGLCLVQRLVDLHGGTVEVYSALGQGSEFVIRLPVMLTSVPPSPSLSTGTARATGTGCRVLVVDDNKDAATMLAMLLESSGHDVRMAHDGPTALKTTIDYRPDVVLLDIGLPGLDGFEVAKRIRQQPTLKNIVLVAVTGYGQESDRERSQYAGFDHHLVKPADFDTVQQILTTVSEKAT